MFFHFLKFFDYQIFVTVILILIAWRWGDWRNWSRYYATILFFIVGDFACTILTYQYPLWQFESALLKVTGSEFLIIAVFFPATLLVFLPHYPKEKRKQVWYILAWVVIYTAIEWISFLSGFFSYHNGWNILWSALFNLLMFPLLILHQRKPPLAWLLGLIFAFCLLIYFKVPFSSMK